MNRLLLRAAARLAALLLAGLTPVAAVAAPHGAAFGSWSAFWMLVVALFIYWRASNLPSAKSKD